MIDVKNKHVTVVGMGRTAMGLVRLLLREGALPIVSDSENRAGLQPFKEELESLGVPYECGNHSAVAFERAQIVMPSPGVPPRIEPIARAVANGAALVSELDFAFSRCSKPVLAVTGTNGKTTTTELLAALIRACGRSVGLAGNNARPFSAALLDTPQPDYFVLEISSYQLETSNQFRPWIGAILNVTPDHLARHTTMDEYAATKAKMFAKQSKDDFAVVNADDPVCVRAADKSAAKRLEFSLRARVREGLWLDGESIRDGKKEVARTSDVPLPGRHNLANALAALTMARAGGFDWVRCLEGLRAFRAVEHRIEPVFTFEGVDYVNDSKSTNIDSLRVALESFDRPIVLIAGGRGKGSDYGVLRSLVTEHVKAMVTIGEDAPKLEAAFGDLVTTVRAPSMDEAVARAHEQAAAGDVVLLSPGCASFDWFTNFEERGRVFKSAVERFAGRTRLAAGA
jgi:UDP-N-acetylmuramoylalanine--D-glutamate ligase